MGPVLSAGQTAWEELITVGGRCVCVCVGVGVGRVVCSIHMGLGQARCAVMHVWQIIEAICLAHIIVLPKYQRKLSYQCWVDMKDLLP